MQFTYLDYSRYQVQKDSNCKYLYHGCKYLNYTSHIIPLQLLYFLEYIVRNNEALLYPSTLTFFCMSWSRRYLHTCLWMNADHTEEKIRKLKYRKKIYNTKKLFDGVFQIRYKNDFSCERMRVANCKPGTGFSNK